MSPPPAPPQEDHGRISDFYYDLKEPLSYSGPAKLSAYRNPLQFVRRQQSYTLHKPVRNLFKRRKTIVYTRAFLYQIDLIDLKSLSRHNNGYKYILVCIDCFSRFVDIEAIKNKTSECVLDAIKIVFTRMTKPRQVQSDQGLEFLNSKAQKYFKQNNIKHYYTISDMKASMVERVIRTLKAKMFKNFTHMRYMRYLDDLSDIVLGYNNTIHRSTGYSPNSIDDTNEHIVINKLYGDSESAICRLAIGDCVRIKLDKGIFSKGYKQSWSDEVYTVRECNTDFSPELYKIDNNRGDTLTARFYFEELQKILCPTII